MKVKVMLNLPFLFCNVLRALNCQNWARNKIWELCRGFPSQLWSLTKRLTSSHQITRYEGHPVCYIFKQKTTLFVGLSAWKPTRDVGWTRGKLVNHSPTARDLQAFRMFSQHPKSIAFCPRRDFARKAKSGGGTLVTRKNINESTYSWNIQSR